MKFSDEFERGLRRWCRTIRPSDRCWCRRCCMRRMRLDTSPTKSSRKSPKRLELTELEVRNVISYYSMLTTKPRGKIQRAGLHQYQLHAARRRGHSASLRERSWASDTRQTTPDGHVHAGRSRVHRRMQLGAGGPGELRLPREPDGSRRWIRFSTSIRRRERNKAKSEV